MKPKFEAALLILGALAVGQSVGAGEPSAPYGDTRVEARLNVEVKNDTQVVHFIRDNVDPDVVTRTYVLQHADPYEIRGYLRQMVQTRKVDASDTGIQAIRYHDGTGIVMVSAEDYRFEDSANGQGIDSIVATLDQPRVVAVTGQPMYLYHPKYRAASELRAMVRAAGADVSEDVTENIGGSDRIQCDRPLNLLFFKTTRFSRKNIAAALKNYDIPYPEIRAQITVYEIYAENDAKIGLDFQAWKNNDGIDLFSSGARYRYNYAADGSGLARHAGWSDTQYFNFNPKWNTKYIDFLAAKGKAKVVHRCELTARNRTTAVMERTSSVFLATATPLDASELGAGYLYLPDTAFGVDADGAGTVLHAVTTGGQAIAVVPDDPAEPAVTLTVLRLANAGYVLRVENGHFEIGGKNVGTRADAGWAEVTVTEAGGGANPKLQTETLAFTSDNLAVQKGNRIDTTPSDQFGFRLALTPVITDRAAMLTVNVTNSSLIGYQSNGAARIQQGVKLASEFLISNAGTRLVIGGLEKRDVVSVSGGVPVLKDIPLLGWLFATESESTKRSQLLVVAEVVPVRPGEVLAAATVAEMQQLDDTLRQAGVANTFGYRQFLLDAARNQKGVEP